MNFARAIFVSFLAMCPVVVDAATQTTVFSWSVPTARVDGTAMPVSELAGYSIFYKIDNGSEQRVDVTPGSATTKSVDLTLAPRDTPYVLSASIVATDTKGQSSSRSTVVTKSITILPALPSAPGNFTLTITCAAGSCTLVVQ